MLWFIMLAVRIGLVVITATCFSAAQVDANKDGTPEIVSISRYDQSLLWHLDDLSTGLRTELGAFGIPGDTISFDNWRSRDIFSRTRLWENEFDELVVQADYSEATQSLGVVDGASWVSLQRDIDKNGVMDVVAAVRKGRLWSWRILLNPFSENPTRLRFLFGKASHTPVVFRSRGKSERLGVVQFRRKRSLVSSRSTHSRRVKKLRIRVQTPRERPTTLRDSSGKDLFVFMEGTRLFTVNQRGRQEGLELYIPDGTRFVPLRGADDRGQVVGLVGGSLISVGGVRYETLNAPGALVSELSEVQLESSEEQGSDEQSQQLATPRPTIPKAIATATPFVQPTATAIATATHTAVPTATPTLSPTATHTPTPTSTPTVTPTLDVIAPIVTVDPLLATQHPFVISGTVSEPLTSLTVVFGGISVQATPDSLGAWSISSDSFGSPKADGSYEITAVAVDDAGNVGTDSSANELTIDTTAPAVVISDNKFNSTLFTFNGSVDDPLSELSLTIAGVDLSKIPSSDGTWSFSSSEINPSGLSEGTYTLTVQARDRAGNLSTSEAQVEVDLTPPTILNVSWPEDGVYEANGKLRVELHMSEPVSMVGGMVLPLTIDYTTSGYETLRQATFSQDASDGSIIVLEYTVGALESDANGVLFGNLLSTTGGGITDEVGNSFQGTFDLSPFSIPADDNNNILVDGVGGPYAKPLDSGTAPVHAYGLRLLRSDYSGPLLRARGYTSEETAEIYPTANGHLNVAHLIAFWKQHEQSAPSTVRMRNLYDQMENGGTLGRLDRAYNPPIIDALGNPYSFGTKFGASFDGNNDRLNASGVNCNSVFAGESSVFIVGSLEAASSQPKDYPKMITCGDFGRGGMILAARGLVDGGSNNSLSYNRGSGSGWGVVGAGQSYTANAEFAYAGFTTSSDTIIETSGGQTQETSGVPYQTTNQDLWLGGEATNDADNFRGTFAELILFSSDVSGNAAALLAEQKAYYGIP